jgi:hypothetical protein
MIKASFLHPKLCSWSMVNWSLSDSATSAVHYLMVLPGTPLFFLPLILASPALLSKYFTKLNQSIIPLPVSTFDHQPYLFLIPFRLLFGAIVLLNINIFIHTRSYSRAIGHLGSNRRVFRTHFRKRRCRHGSSLFPSTRHILSDMIGSDAWIPHDPRTLPHVSL